VSFYAECHYAECRGTPSGAANRSQSFYWVLNDLIDSIMTKKKKFILFQNAEKVLRLSGKVLRDPLECDF
jgi:hypothetical protein